MKTKKQVYSTKKSRTGRGTIVSFNARPRCHAITRVSVFQPFLFKTGKKEKKEKQKAPKSSPVNPRIISSPAPHSFVHVAHVGISTRGITESSKNIKPAWSALMADLQGCGVAPERVEADKDFVEGFLAGANARTDKPATVPQPQREIPKFLEVVLLMSDLCSCSNFPGTTGKAQNPKKSCHHSVTRPAVTLLTILGFSYRTFDSLILLLAILECLCFISCMSSTTYYWHRVTVNITTRILMYGNISKVYTVCYQVSRSGHCDKK